jgi:hypothetical protein
VDVIQTLDFVFMMHLMKVILGITNDLNLGLQWKDQDIVRNQSKATRNEKPSCECMLTKANEFCLI